MNLRVIELRIYKGRVNTSNDRTMETEIEIHVGRVLSVNINFVHFDELNMQTCISKWTKQYK